MGSRSAAVQMIRLEQSAAACAAGEAFPVRIPDALLNRPDGPTIAVRLPNWLGDAVMTVPALKVLSLLAASLGGRLAAVATPSSYELARALCPEIFRSGVLIENAHRTWTEEEQNKVKALKADFVMLFTNSLRDVLQFRKAGVRHLAGAGARMRGIFLDRSFHFPRRVRHRLNPPHLMNRYLAMARAIGAPAWDGEYPEIKPSLPIEQAAPEIAALTEHPKLLLMAAGAAYGAGKRWPSASYARVAERYIASGGIAAVLGGESEKAIGEEIVRDLPSRKAFNLCGKTGFQELLHLMKSARCMVANDSGLMHLGAMVGVPGVAVFGPTDYAATGPAPARGGWVVLADPLPCSPCFHRTCASGGHCIARVTPEQVIAELEKF